MASCLFLPLLQLEVRLWTPGALPSYRDLLCKALVSLASELRICCLYKYALLDASPPWRTPSRSAGIPRARIALGGTRGNVDALFACQNVVQDLDPVEE